MRVRPARVCGAITVVMATAISGGMASGLATAAPDPPPGPDENEPDPAGANDAASGDEPPTPFVHPTDAHNPDCVIEIQPGESLSTIAERMPDTAVTYDDLARENRITNPDQINAGAYLDLCVGNQINDITGRSIGESGVEIVDADVADQQRQLNALFASTGFPALLIDGVSGPLTRRGLCAFRSIFGLETSRADMTPGSAEERALLAATELPHQGGDPPNRWVLIDKTCQVLIAGAGPEIVYIWPASTGEPGYETRNQSRVRAFRYNPASHNSGWHDSTVYPVGVDNPLNGNMYKPIYFDNGQAIHGSYNVPPEPRSKGCVRLLPEHQDQLVNWIGLGGATSPVWSRGEIGLIVHVRGQY